jgi:ADP-ribosyl-[dinitrogen reductase] hydrolase
MNKSDLNGGGRARGAGSSRSTSNMNIVGDVINHGKQDLWSPNKAIHYHATLQAGENTLEVSIARVLMKSIVSNGGIFDADHFRSAYVTFMTTPGSHNDVYASTCHRMFFANMIFKNLPPKDCPDNDSHNVDTQVRAYTILKN